MKKFILLFGLIALFIACSDDSSSANNEKQNSLQLNEGCEKFVTDSSLWKAIQDSDLASLKKSIENCASLDMNLYDSSSYANQEVIRQTLLSLPLFVSLINFFCQREHLHVQPIHSFCFRAF